MDPASILAIISACSGITRNAAAFITGLNSFVDRLKNVELDLGSLDAQTGILSLASERLRLWIIAHDTELNEEERKSLWKCTDHCEQLLRALRTVTEKAKKVSKAEDAEGRSHKAGRIGFWKKLGTVFAQPKLDRYINDLERQTHALATFLQIFESTDRENRLQRLQSPQTTEILDDAASCAFETTSWIRQWLRESSGDDTRSVGQDSGFDEPEADRFSEISTNSPQGSVASSYNPSIAPGVPLTDEHLSKHNMTLAESGKTKPGVAGAPDDDDDGSSTTTSDDFKSVPTVRGENTGSHLPSVATSQSPYNIRDELEEMSVVLSNIDENDDQTLEKIHGNLTRLQQVMLEVYRARQEAQGRPPDLSLELERQIEALFIQIRETLHSIGNEDERILRGQNPTITNAKGQTGLHLALRKEPTDVALIKRFIELGASLTALDNEGNTPLLSLLTYSNFLEDGKLQQIKVKQAFDSFLRASAASDIGINAATNDGAAALHLLANCNTNVEFIRALVNRGADINVRHRRKESWTPLHVAASSQNATIVVAVLISCGADVNASSSTGDSPLHQSLSGASWFPERSVEQLLLAGAASDSSNIALRRPLDLALKLLSLYERRLASLQDDDWWWATASMEVRHISEMLCIIDMLFQRILELSIHRESSSVIATTYTFEEVGDLDRIAIPQLRALFRRRRVEILVKTKRELYEDLKMWYRIP